MLKIKNKKFIESLRVAKLNQMRNMIFSKLNKQFVKKSVIA